jgi:hypothetical protein
MTRLTLLVLIAAFAVPSAAFAISPDRDPGTRAALNAHGVDEAAANRKAIAVEEYYSSYGEPAATKASAPVVEPSVHTGPSWFGTLGIGVGLILLAGGLGVYAGRSLRPRHLGA